MRKINNELTVPTRDDSISNCWDHFIETTWPVMHRSRALSEALLGVFRGFERFVNVRQPVSNLCPDMINTWLRGRLADGLGWSRAKLNCTYIKLFCEWCEAFELVKRNPYQRLRLPRMPEHTTPRRLAFTHAQYEKVIMFINATKDEEEALWWSATCHIGYWTGMRLSDVVSIRWEEPPDGEIGTWLDLVEERIVCHPVKKRPRRERLEIPIEPELYEVLMRISVLREDSPFIFNMMRLVHKYAPWEASRRYHALFRKAGLPNHTFHCFRHAFVTRMINCGVNPIIIASMTGQTLLQIQQYSHVSHEAKSVALIRSREALHDARRIQFGFQSERR